MTRSGELVNLTHEKDYYSEVGLGVKQKCVERKGHVALNQADDKCFYSFFGQRPMILLSDGFYVIIYCLGGNP